MNVSDSEIVPPAPPTILIPNDDVLLQCIEQSFCNWFQFMSEMEKTYSITDSTVLEDVYNRLLPKLHSRDQELLTQSHSAYIHIQKEELPCEQRNIDALNGLIVSESEAEDPDAYLPNAEVGIEEQKRNLAQSRMQMLQRAARRKRAKLIAERNFWVVKEERRQIQF